ncbi:MAG: Ni/Fe hydrogenase subunit gamma [candidate division Zixibacteria bacterium]|nr:Ni/Fe hydrogenase subunit gamma [candidate division Zixibacteria bacterium]
MATMSDSKTNEINLTEPMITRPFRVNRAIKDTHDTFSLELTPSGNSNKFDFAPGQFNMLYVFGVGEVPISISGDPAKQSKLVHTTRAVGNVTKAMNKLKAGDTLGVRGPFGTAWPVKEAEGEDVVLVAGGIGLAPLRPVIYHLLANRGQYGKIALLYGARTPEDILFQKTLEKWRSRFDFEMYITVDRATGNWKGNVGVVTQLIPRSPFDPLNCVAMICGPEIMMRFTVLELEKRGVTTNKIYVSMERNMKCGIGLCGHCQLGRTFICKDGAVYPYSQIADLFTKREL